MFLLNSRYSLFYDTAGEQYFLSQSYKVILPSSFKIITSYAFTY